MFKNANWHSIKFNIYLDFKKEKHLEILGIEKYFLSYHYWENIHPYMWDWESQVHSYWKCRSEHVDDDAFFSSRDKV